MQSKRSQEGFLLIVAILIIAVVAAMAVAMLTLTAGSGEAGGIHINSTQAFYAAETGVERALRGYTKQGVACSALTFNGTLTVGSDTASYSTSGTSYTPAATALSAGINTTTTVIPVNTVAGYATHGRIAVGGESINYTGTSTSVSVCGAGNPACFTGATRGVGGTAAAAAVVGTTVTQSQCIVRSVATANNTQRTVDRAVFSGGSGAMATYVHENNLGVPYYRLWNGAAWGAEATATTTGSEIHYMVLKSARTRSEYILVTQSANGNIHAQIWNGTSWTSDGVTAGATRLLGNVANAGDREYRAFDVEYESATDRAMVVYRNANNADPDYQFWDGTAWSATATATPNGTTSRPRWIELAAHPDTASNEMVMLVSDSSSDMHGSRWTGAAWSNMGVAGDWDTSTATSTTKVIDVVYEQNGLQRPMFVWVDNANCTLRYRQWNGANLTAIQNVGSWTNCGDQGDWVKLAADPSSDDILLGVQDQDNDMGTCFWNGAAWSCAAAAHPEHATDVESGANRTFDVVFATDPATPGEAWLVWGALAGGGTNIWRRRWTGAGWDAIDIFLGPDLCFPYAVAHPNTGVIFVGNYEDADSGEISVTQHTGGAWSATSTPLWNTGTTLDCQAGALIHERIAIATQRAGLTVFDWLEILR